MRSVVVAMFFLCFNGLGQELDGSHRNGPPGPTRRSEKQICEHRIVGHTRNGLLYGTSYNGFELYLGNTPDRLTLNWRTGEISERYKNAEGTGAPSNLQRATLFSSSDNLPGDPKDSLYGPRVAQLKRMDQFAKGEDNRQAFEFVTAKVSRTPENKLHVVDYAKLESLRSRAERENYRAVPKGSEHLFEEVRLVQLLKNGKFRIVDSDADRPLKITEPNLNAGKVVKIRGGSQFGLKLLVQAENKALGAQKSDFLVVDLETGQVKNTGLGPHINDTMSHTVSLSPDGKYVAYILENGLVGIMEVSPDCELLPVKPNNAFEEIREKVVGPGFENFILNSTDEKGEKIPYFLSRTSTYFQCADSQSPNDRLYGEVFFPRGPQGEGEKVSWSGTGWAGVVILDRDKKQDAKRKVEENQEMGRKLGSLNEKERAEAEDFWKKRDDRSNRILTLIEILGPAIECLDEKNPSRLKCRDTPELQAKAEAAFREHPDTFRELLSKEVLYFPTRVNEVVMHKGNVTYSTYTGGAVFANSDEKARDRMLTVRPVKFDDSYRMTAILSFDKGKSATTNFNPIRLLGSEDGRDTKRTIYCSY